MGQILNSIHYQQLKYNRPTASAIVTLKQVSCLPSFFAEIIIKEQSNSLFLNTSYSYTTSNHVIGRSKPNKA
jgi:hypothetical protein